ncbi:MAG: hypothetical protein QOG84_2639 [Sphingomonadales bacterium]|nr:hypothetical protein [Sphingomonadales bacterium]
MDDPLAFYSLILALSTTLLCIFTGALWWATYRLSKDAKESSEAQADKMERSIAEAGRSAEAMGKLADHASAQLAITQDSVYRNLRAYLSVKKIVCTGFYEGLIGGRIILENAGETPAEITIFSIGWIGKWPLGKPRDHGPEPERHFDSKPFINRGSEDSVQWFYPRNEKTAEKEIAEWIANSATLIFYLYGRAEFLDYRRRRRILHFSYRTNGRPKVGKPFEMVPTAEGNDYEDQGEAKT